ncbi:hypothetical protein BKA69DRAFT_430218 [Paraphysoderma sedebokerense]|nr:hypothetical protein BKA69DRAFT_430218 [Paraphysoderma sedebokerense]
MPLFPSFIPPATPNVIFWFCVMGAGAASLKHLISPIPTLQELTPVAVRTTKDKNSSLSPEGYWWGSLAFSAMNLGYCVVGLWAGYCGSNEAKQGFLLGTGVLFEAFSLAWFTKGHITGKKDYKKQGTKVGMFGVLFLYGFALML